MELATIQEQKDLTQYIRSYIKKHGDPYDFDLFEFNVDQRRDCLNWMTFLGFVNKIEDATRKNQRLNKTYIEDVKGVAGRYFIRYYPLEYEKGR